MCVCVCSNGNMTRTQNLVVVTCDTKHLPNVLRALVTTNIKVSNLPACSSDFMFLKWEFLFYKCGSYPYHPIGATVRDCPQFEDWSTTPRYPESKLHQLAIGCVNWSTLLYDVWLWLTFRERERVHKTRQIWHGNFPFIFFLCFFLLFLNKGFSNQVKKIFLQGQNAYNLKANFSVGNHFCFKRSLKHNDIISLVTLKKFSIPL